MIASNKNTQVEVNISSGFNGESFFSNCCTEYENLLFVTL